MNPKLIPRYNWDYGLSEYLVALSGALRLRSPDRSIIEKHFGRNVVMTSSGRASLYAILKSLELPEGAGVGVPLFCCPVVFDAILEAGLVPVFIDSESDGFNLCPNDLAKKRNRISALVVVHMFGHPADMDAILGVAGGLPVIEDCAQALFSTYKGKIAGTIADISFFSFRSGKYVSAGEGSFIIAKDPGLAEVIRELVETFPKRGHMGEVIHCSATLLKSALYKRPWYGTVSLPLGRRLDKKLNLTAKSGFRTLKIASCDLAVISSRLGNFASQIEKQRENSKFLSAHLKGASFLWPDDKIGSKSNHYQYPIRFPNQDMRDRFSRFLNENDIDAASYLDDIVDVAKRYFGYPGDCPDAETASKTTLTIPNYYTLAPNDLDNIVTVLSDASKLFD